MFAWPHSVHVDQEGNVWVVDARRTTPEEQKKFPGEPVKGNIVVKFSPEGKVLLTLGQSGVAGNPPDAFTDPNDVVTAPNGDIYVSESHTNLDTTPNAVARISVFDRNGKFIRTFGKLGSGPGEFRTPHAMVFDSRGRLIVADRANHRIQVLDKDGKFLAEFKDFSRVSGLTIDRNDTIYASDSESDAKRHPGWQKGVRIGSLKDGKVERLHPGARDRFARWRRRRRHRARRRWQFVCGGGDCQRGDEVRQMNRSVSESPVSGLAVLAGAAGP